MNRPARGIRNAEESLPKTYFLALDLKDDPGLIGEYERYHRNIWPEIRDSILAKGITGMEIYRTGNRLVMVMHTVPEFSFEEAARMDAANPVVHEWEELMWGYQQPLPHAAPGQKWMLMEKIFDLSGE
jgi:L-rhamnose mutarotase